MKSRTLAKRQNPTVVSLSDESELHYWCARLRVSPGLLHEAMRSAGPRLCDMENYLIWKEA